MSDGTSCSCPMETMVPGRMPRVGILLLSLLLCFGPETTRSINPDALKVIVNYVDSFRPDSNNQYAAAVSLPQAACNLLEEQQLREYLSEEELKEMKAKLNSKELFEGQNIVAARPKFQKKKPTLHSEFLLLSPDQNGISPISRLLDKTRDQRTCPETHVPGKECGNNCYQKWSPDQPCGWNSCLIFFTKYSPCLGTCLNSSNCLYIRDLMDGVFGAINNNFRALAFRQVYPQDMAQKQKALWEAWQTIQNAPMYMCDNNGCASCEEKILSQNPCLKGVPEMRAMPQRAHE
ncbi:uncharacterized protein LOC127036589 [Gopherus flavomarginatus]|uniref:uncharacterized protein LOC127036589 n=1 Tax=Gopherus flavomarginatus TaxID=286002 RepID=UPI0021CBF1AD|nr:uncharacterized protein LOC127036589 [Gopherus flavomarginatus]